LTTNPDWRERQCGNPDCGISRNLAEANLDDKELCILSLAAKGLSLQQIADEAGFSSRESVVNLFRDVMAELGVESIWEVVSTAHQTLGLLGTLEDFE